MIEKLLTPFSNYVGSVSDGHMGIRVRWRKSMEYVIKCDTWQGTDALRAVLYVKSGRSEADIV